MSEPDSKAALARLEPFIGLWDVGADMPQVPDTDAIEARTEFEWQLGGQFLAQRATISIPEAPDFFGLIGVNADGDGYTQHYFDSRGIARTYAMTFDGRVWTLTRDKPDFTPLEFSQRWTATFDDDGRTIRGTWEICHDGTTWERDFDLTYTRLG